MTPTEPLQPPLLDTAWALFLAGPVAINVASRSAALVPSVARAFGCRLSADRREITLLLAAGRSRAVIRDLADGAPIAAIFSRPKTHVSLQLKGAGASIHPVTAEDQELMLAWGEAFAAEICAQGHSDTFGRNITRPAAEPAVAVRFTPNALFEQTPGPRAGERLGGQA